MPSQSAIDPAVGATTGQPVTEPSYDPRTGRAVAGPARTAPDQVAAMVSAAAAAFPVISQAGPADRRTWMDAVADALDREREALVTLADEETALGPERLAGELTRGAQNMRYYATAGERGRWVQPVVETVDGILHADLRRANLPLGPVAVFGASNFPFQFGVLGHDTCAAIAVGCPVLVKAHPAHPRLSVRLAELARQALSAAGAPDGILAMVVGFDAGLQLVDAPEVSAVAFTGSQQGGMALLERARRRPRPIPVYAEMGTVNPVLITPSAAGRLPEIAQQFTGSFTLGGGQYCTKPGLLLAPAGGDAFRAVAEHARSARPVWLLTGGMAEAFRAGVQELAMAAGGQVVVGAPGDQNHQVRPTVLQVPVDRLTPGSPMLQECFGPVALVAEYRNIDQALEVLGRLQPSLAGAIYSSGPDDPDVPRAVRAMQGQVGRVVMNAPPTGVLTSDAMHHGGPWPATSEPGATSVGAFALQRFTRPVCFQDVPDAALPVVLRDADPWRVRE